VDDNIIKLTIPEELRNDESTIKWAEALEKELSSMFKSTEFKKLRNKMVFEMLTYGESQTLKDFESGKVTLEDFKE